MGGSHFGTVTTPKKYDRKVERIKAGVEARRADVGQHPAQGKD